MGYTRVIYRYLTGQSWPVVVPMYKLRQCPDCFALVLGWEGQEGHEAWHGDPGEDDEPPPIDGYVIGNGELPPETRMGDD